MLGHHKNSQLSPFTLLIASIVYVDYCYANPNSLTKFHQAQLKIQGTFPSKVGIIKKMPNSHNGDHKTASQMAIGNLSENQRDPEIS